MLPASVAADLAYLAVLFSGRTPVMVNWTTGARNILHGLELTGTRCVLTARELVVRLEGQGLDVNAFRERLVFMEDIAKSIKLPAKILAALRARVSWRALDRVQPSDTAAVLFTSGSEAKPKAVPLSHANILANARDVVKIVDIRRTDAMIGFLPPFHSFGLSVNMILPLAAGLRVVHHANPTEGWVTAPLVEAYRASILVGTPTFLAGIARVARPGQLDSVKLAVTGAEKCSESTYALLGEKCPNAVVIEGYGVTECSPIISANRPAAPRAGTIGQPLPSVEHALVDVETHQRAAPGQPGMLLVRGPSVFAGYLGDAPSEPFVEFEGKSWYRTGDLVSEAPDGTLTFSGRLKRFIKLGGEMISLPAIEAVLAERAGAADDEGPVLAVEATPSEDHPEIVLFTTRDIDRVTANRWIREAGLSPLHNISRVERIEEIPLLGTGKTNYRALKDRLPPAPAEAEKS